MPLHVYDCADCEASFEKLVAAGTAPATVIACPECESTHVTRSLFAMPAKPISSPAPTNCAGTGPPCGKTGCGRMRL